MGERWEARSDIKELLKPFVSSLDATCRPEEHHKAADSAQQKCQTGAEALLKELLEVRAPFWGRFLWLAPQTPIQVADDVTLLDMMAKQWELAPAYFKSKWWMNYFPTTMSYLRDKGLKDFRKAPARAEGGFLDASGCASPANYEDPDEWRERAEGAWGCVRSQESSFLP